MTPSNTDGSGPICVQGGSAQCVCVCVCVCVRIIGEKTLDPIRELNPLHSSKVPSAECVQVLLLISCIFFFFLSTLGSKSLISNRQTLLVFMTE